VVRGEAPDKRIDGQPLPWGLPGTGWEVLAAAKQQRRADRGWGNPGTPPCNAVGQRRGSPRSLPSLSQATAVQNNLCAQRARSH